MNSYEREMAELDARIERQAAKELAEEIASIKKAFKVLRMKGGQASFAAAGCSFDIPKNTAMGILKKRLEELQDLSNPNDRYDLHCFYVSAYDNEHEYGPWVSITAGSEVG
jgi:hypothetical protein